MIRSREEFEYFLAADAKALQCDGLRPRPFRDEIWHFQRLLREVEFAMACRHGGLWRPYYLQLRWRFKQLSIRYGFSIPPGVFGPGLAIAHRGTIVVNDRARVGANCRLHVDVNIGAAAQHDSEGVPRIGDNVYIGPGAKLFGDIEIGDGTVIGANAVVNRSFPEGGITIGGVPAKQIADRGSEGLLVRATEELPPFQGSRNG